MNVFWQRWLTVWCAGVGVFGLVLYGVGFASTTFAAAPVFEAFGNALPSEPDRYLRLAVSLMGAVTAGWAITMYAVFRAAWALDPATGAVIWRIAATAIVAWYVIDSIASIRNGFELNAVSNTVLLVTFVVPVIATRAWSFSNDAASARW